MPLLDSLALTALQLNPHAQVWSLNATFALRHVAVKGLLKNELEMKPQGEFSQISFFFFSNQIHHKICKSKD